MRNVVMKKLRSVDEAKEFVASSEQAIIMYAPSEGESAEFAEKLAKSLKSKARNLGVAVFSMEGEEFAPIVIYYEKGKEVMRQREFFMNPDTDAEAILLGLRNRYHKLGEKPPF